MLDVVELQEINTAESKESNEWVHTPYVIQLDKHDDWVDVEYLHEMPENGIENREDNIESVAETEDDDWSEIDKADDLLGVDQKNNSDAWAYVNNIDNADNNHQIIDFSQESNNETSVNEVIDITPSETSNLPYKVSIVEGTTMFVSMVGSFIVFMFLDQMGNMSTRR